jgi:quercetin dioxygenase-like cupin family protein
MKTLIAREAAVRSDFDAGIGITEFLGAADGLPVSLVTARLDGRHPIRHNPRSLKVYYMLGGDMTAEVSGCRHHVRSGDVLVVRPGEVHALEGEGSMLVVCAPPFDAADEVVLESPAEPPR